MRARRGGVLVYVLVFLTLLAFFAALAANLVMHRQMLLERGRVQQQALLNGRSLAALLNDCLLDVAEKTCAAFTLASCGFPAEFEGRQVDAQVRWIRGEGAQDGYCQVRLRLL